jgi:2-haloacid dehalogenase
MKALGCRLAVLTNCDDRLIAQTERAFQRPFDLVVTAEQVSSYKPLPEHFHRFAAVTGVTGRDWVYVACSWHHYIAPAHRLGIQCIWLDRERTDEDERRASARVESATEVSRIVGALYAKAA